MFSSCRWFWSSFLWCVIVIIWLIKRIMNIKMVFILIIVLDVNILRNIFNLIDLKVIVLVKVIIGDFSIIHYSVWYLWLIVILLKAIEHFWFFHVVEGWLFVSILLWLQSLLTFVNTFFHYWYCFFGAFSILFWVFGSQLRNIFMIWITIVNDENLFAFNLCFILLMNCLSIILLCDGVFHHWLSDYVWIVCLYIWCSLLLLGTEDFVQTFELLFLVFNLFENST